MKVKKIILAMTIASGLTTAVMTVVIVPTADAQIVTRQHTCDAPDFAAELHEAHTDQHCGNSMTPNTGDFFGYKEDCNVSYSGLSGGFWSSEDLHCGNNDGPQAGAGCIYTLEVRCGGVLRVHGWIVGSSPNGNLPACGWDAAAGDWFCRNDLGQNTCHCSGSQLNCSDQLNP